MIGLLAPILDPFLGKPAQEVGCHIEIEHTNDFLHAHVSLDDGLELGPGDEVTVHGAAVHVPFGEAIAFDRRATVKRAGWIKREWTKLTARLELTELYEVSFSERSML